jgi:ABC-type uncharacterized transport system ATPase subunit
MKVPRLCPLVLLIKVGEEVRHSDVKKVEKKCEARREV